MEETIYRVYMHTCPNNMRYVGMTDRKHVENRWGINGKQYKKNPKFWEDILEFGWDNIKHEVILETVNEDEAIAKEQELILKYKTYDPEFGYNRNKGGRSTYPTKEKRERLSKANKGKPSPMKGRHHSEETKQKNSEMQKGNHNCLGKKQSKESNRKRSEKLKDRQFSEETNRKRRESLKSYWQLKKQS